MLLGRHEWEPKLERLRCRRDDYQPLKTAEIWCAEWGFVFTVPLVLNGMIANTDFQQIMAAVNNSAPPGTVFKDN